MSARMHLMRSAAMSTPPPEPPPPPPSGDRPDATNTGPTVEPTDTITPEAAIAANGATNKVITGSISYDMPLGSTFTLVDCVVEGDIGINVDGGNGSYARIDYPTLNLTRVRATGNLLVINAIELNGTDTWFMRGAGMIAPCNTCAGSEDFGLEREMPWTLTNCWFLAPQGTPPEHTEGAHIAGAGWGYTFINTRFSQEGPNNGSATSALFYYGSGGTYTDCWFDSNGTDVPTYFPVYAYGNGSHGDNVFTRCHLQNFGDAEGPSYWYPVTAEDPGWGIAVAVDCVDYPSGDPIPGPSA